MRKRCLHARTLQYKLTLAEEDQLYDNAVESNLPVSVTPPPSPPLLLFQDSQDQPPKDLPPPRAVRRLALETAEIQQATDFPPPRLPSREHATNSLSVGEEVPFPAWPVLYCS
jgi:hypothetical protein